MRLRRRFFLAILVLAVVLSALSVVGFTMYRDATIAQEAEEIGRVSETIATQLDVVLTEKGRSVELWTQQPALGTHGSAEQQAAVRSFVSSTNFSGASVIAANGTMTAFYSRNVDETRSAALVGQEFGDRRYFQRAMDGDTYVSDPVAADSGNMIVTISAPIRSDGAVVGTFNAAFHVREGDLFGSIRTRTSSTEGIHVFADDSTVFTSGPTLSSPETVGVANATVGETGWTVTVTRTQGAVSSDLQTITLLQASTLGLVLVSLAIFGRWVYGEYVGNFERLEAGLSALADGDYGTTVALSGSTEWAAVGEDFNELSATLARRRVEVAVLNRVLRHNLRNAMTVISGSAARIAQQVDDEATTSDARRIERRGQSLLDLADHARVVESSLRVDRSESPSRPIAMIVDEAASALSEEYPDAAIETGSIPGDVLVPDGDLVAVAVDELVRNAVIHADGHPTVVIDVLATDADVSITVSDDGPGLPPVERRLLTEQFVETPTEHSSGLGLWVVKWITDGAGGSIDVDVDGGTAVTVTLPRADTSS